MPSARHCTATAGQPNSPFDSWAPPEVPHICALRFLFQSWSASFNQLCIGSCGSIETVEMSMRLAGKHMKLVCGSPIPLCMPISAAAYDACAPMSSLAGHGQCPPTPHDATFFFLSFSSEVTAKSKCRRLCQIFQVVASAAAAAPPPAYQVPPRWESPRRGGGRPKAE